MPPPPLSLPSQGVPWAPAAPPAVSSPFRARKRPRPFSQSQRRPQGREEARRCRPLLLSPSRVLCSCSCSCSRRRCRCRQTAKKAPPPRAAPPERSASSRTAPGCGACSRAGKEAAEKGREQSGKQRREQQQQLWRCCCNSSRPRRSASSAEASRTRATRRGVLLSLLRPPRAGGPPRRLSRASPGERVRRGVRP